MNEGNGTRHACLPSPKPNFLVPPLPLIHHKAEEFFSFYKSIGFFLQGAGYQLWVSLQKKCNDTLNAIAITTVWPLVLS